MSRIGRLPVTVPAGVTVDLKDDGSLLVKGPKGQLEWRLPESITMENDDGTLKFTRPDDQKRNRALHGLARTLVNNMITGVTTGFSKSLDLVGVGYRAQKQGNKLVLAVGYSHPVEFIESNGITFDVPAPGKIIVNGIDKQAVGETAAKIRKVRPPEPYLGKGIKYTDEVILRKEGKAGKK